MELKDVLGGTQEMEILETRIAEDETRKAERSLFIDFLMDYRPDDVEESICRKVLDKILSADEVAAEMAEMAKRLLEREETPVFSQEAQERLPLLPPRKRQRTSTLTLPSYDSEPEDEEPPAGQASQPAPPPPTPPPVTPPRPPPTPASAIVELDEPASAVSAPGKQMFNALQLVQQIQGLGRSNSKVAKLENSMTNVWTIPTDDDMVNIGPPTDEIQYLTHMVSAATGTLSHAQIFAMHVRMVLIGAAAPARRNNPPPEVYYGTLGAGRTLEQAKSVANRMDNTCRNAARLVAYFGWGVLAYAPIMLTFPGGAHFRTSTKAWCSEAVKYRDNVCHGEFAAVPYNIPVENFVRKHFAGLIQRLFPDVTDPDTFCLLEKCPSHILSLS